MMRANQSERIEHIHHLIQILLEQLTKESIPYEMNGNMNDHRTHIVNLYFPWVKNDVLLTNLDLAQIAVSSGSACTAGAIEPSHVLIAMYGDDNERIYHSIRISLSEENTVEEINQFVYVIKRLYDKLG